MLKFVLASNNAKKLEEMRRNMEASGRELISLSEAGVLSEPDETGASFEENALIKAEAAMNCTGLPAVADDSGLSVYALDGAPGVYSARYGGSYCQNDGDRVKFLLKNMEDKEQRGAKFVSCIACVFPDGRKLTAHGDCEGEITRTPRGVHGFGYDPVFYLPQFGKTMAEITPEQKNMISHRAKAIAEFMASLDKILPYYID